MDDDNVFAAGRTPSGTADPRDPEHAILQYLRETRPWLQVLTLFYGLLGASLVGVAAIVALAFAVEGFSGANEPGFLLTVAGLGFAGLSYATGALYTARAAVADPTDLAGAAGTLRHHRNLWRAYSVSAILGFALFVVWVLVLGDAFETAGSP